MVSGGVTSILLELRYFQFNAIAPVGNFDSITWICLLERGNFKKTLRRRWLSFVYAAQDDVHIFVGKDHSLLAEEVMKSNAWSYLMPLDISIIQ